jgi:hypothetical protein
MKIAILLILISMLAGLAMAQPKTISEQEYRSAFDYAISETNSRFPFTHTFKAEYFANNKVTSLDIHIAERQERSVERQTFTTIKDGKTTTTYQTRSAAGDNVYCSSDGMSWIGPQVYECPRERRLYRPQPATSTEYSVEDTVIDGKKVKVYRKYELFKIHQANSLYIEEVATIDSDGLFISTVKNMGESETETRSIKTRLTNTWDLKTKFPKIVAPKNATPPKKDKDKGSTMILRTN